MDDHAPAAVPPGRRSEHHHRVESIPESVLVEYTRDAARLAAMSRAERLARELDRD